MRWAFKLFYDGTNFHGSQIQPKLRTVQGELIKALNKLDYIKGKISFCCRTDAGVSALSQVVVAELTRKPIIGEINSVLPKDMLIWAFAEVPENISARHLVEWKLYRYYLPLLPEEKIDLNNIIKASELIRGRKELGGLSKSKKGGLIDEIKISEREGVLIMDFKGKYFSWNLVRRSVSALYMVGSGRLSIDQFMNILNNHEKGVHPAPPWGLILLDVGCKLNFTVDQRALHRLISISTNLSLIMRSRAIMLNDLRTFCNSLSVK